MTKILPELLLKAHCTSFIYKKRSESNKNELMYATLAKMKHYHIFQSVSEYQLFFS